MIGKKEAILSEVYKSFVDLMVALTNVNEFHNTSNKIEKDKKVSLREPKMTFQNKEKSRSKL